MNVKYINVTLISNNVYKRTKNIKKPKETLFKSYLRLLLLVLNNKYFYAQQLKIIYIKYSS